MSVVPDAVVKLRTPGELVQAVPRLLGYVPTDSVVAVLLKGSRRRIELTLRYDLEVAAAEPLWLVDTLAERARMVTAREVMVIVYGDCVPSADADLPYRELADLMEAKWRLPLREMVFTAEGRWWSYLCSDPHCCPSDGNVLDPDAPAVGRLAAEAAVGGLALLPDRSALVRSVSLDADADAEHCRDAVAGAILTAAETDLAVRRRRVRELTDRLLDRLRDPRETVSDDEAFELAGLIWHVVVRDEVLVLGGDQDRRELLLRLYRQVVRRVPPPFDAPPCTLLSWFAYADGDGTTANIALDRALDTDPGYSLAALIADALDRQVPPSCLHEVMDAAKDDLGRWDAAKDDLGGRGAADDIDGRSAAG